MADMIKKLFEKKKQDAKFKLAGPGHKLSEEKQVEENVEDKNVKRSEPCSEAKQAGLAALARFAASSSTTPGFSMSMANMRNQIRQEIAQERKSDGGASSNSFEEKSPLLAVQGVFYKCPLIGPEVLSKEEWRVKIRNYLYEQLEVEGGLISCLIIHSCNKNKEKIEQCIETLSAYLENIIANPEEEKFQRIRLSNRIFQEKVSKIEGALDFLLAAGFENKKLPFKDVEEEFLVFNPEKSDIEVLKLLLDALRSAEPIGIELDRNLQVLLPSQAAIRVQLPNDFYSLTPDEIKKEQQLRTERLESSMQLKTKAMREKEEQREIRKYRYCVIRVRFPDGVLLQGTFSVYDKFRSVRDFVMENLKHEEKFVLSTGLGHQLSEADDNSSLLDLRLVPATMLIFAWNVGVSFDTYLKEDLMALVKD